MLPFGITGRVRLSASPDADTVLRRLVQALQAARASEVHQTDQSVAFRAGVFRLVVSWNPLVAIGSGNLVVRREESETLIDYALSFRQLLVVTFLLTAVFLGIAIFSAPNVSTGEGVLLLAGAWIWLYGGN